MTPNQHQELLQDLFDNSFEYKPEIFIKIFREKVKHQLDKHELQRQESCSLSDD